MATVHPDKLAIARACAQAVQGAVAGIAVLSLAMALVCQLPGPLHNIFLKEDACLVFAAKQAWENIVVAQQPVVIIPVVIPGRTELIPVLQHQLSCKRSLARNGTIMFNFMHITQACGLNGKELQETQALQPSIHILGVQHLLLPQSFAQEHPQARVQA